MSDRPMSDRQRTFLSSLSTDREVPEELLTRIIPIVQELEPITTRQASSLIDHLLTLPRKASESEQAVPADKTATEGYYVRHGEVFVVVLSQAGRPYAKRLAVYEDCGVKTGSWEYAPGAHRTLNDDDRLTAAEAARLGKLHGFCVRCCRTLDDVRSVAAGYGSTCAKREGWPYPTLDEARRMVEESEAARV